MRIKKYVKPKFVDKILAEGAKVIKGLQMEAADDWGVNDDSGELRKSLRGHFSVTQLGEGTRLTMRYVKYLVLAICLGWQPGKKVYIFTIGSCSVGFIMTPICA